MTLGEAYRAGKKLLEAAGNAGPAFDASCLFQKAFGLDRQQRTVRSSEPAAAEKTEAYFRMARERAGGRPLQYILGEWPFLGLSLEVGEGVLIPREETELLVRAAAKLLEGVPEPKILDLCAGSGAVALGLASLLPGARVFAAEKYEGALSYLRRNIRKTGLAGVAAAALDVLDPASAEDFRVWTVWFPTRLMSARARSPHSRPRCGANRARRWTAARTALSFTARSRRYGCRS
jgi:release factor glutamine methyltransferase